MTPSDVAILDQLRAHAESHRVGADAIVAIAEGRSPTVVGEDPRHRAFLSDGVVAVFSIEDYSKIEPVPDPGPFARRGWVRHASISQQRRFRRSTASREVLVANVRPTETLVREIASCLGFSVAALVFPSPDLAGPLIQHVLEDVR